MQARTGEVVGVDGRRVDVDWAMAGIEKGQQLAHHYPSAEALAHARRVLTGEISYDEAIAELDRDYGRV